MKEFLAIFKTRTIEFYRDKAGMAWAFIFPLLIIVGCALAFANPDTTVFNVGIIGEKNTYQQVPLLQQPYVKIIHYESLEKPSQRIRYHQLDLLLKENEYWVNPESSRGSVVETLLLQSATDDFSRQELTGRAVRYVDWVIPGVLGMNLMFGSLFGIGYVIVRYRRNGVLKRLQATPVTPLQFLSAHLVSRLLIVVAVNVIIFVGCSMFLDLLVIGSYSSLLVITLLGGLSMSSVGLVVASRIANEELAGGLLNAASWPMLFLSEVWFSLDNSPEWMRTVADFLPLTHLVKATRAVMIEGASMADVSYHLIWMLLLTLVCLGISSALFRWHSGR